MTSSPRPFTRIFGTALAIRHHGGPDGRFTTRESARRHAEDRAYIGGSSTKAEGRPVLDEDGAYHIYQQFLDERVQFVDAEAELAIDKLSKAVRKGEPYAGDGVGMHFPLKRDTEVLVAYRNGDPDPAGHRRGDAGSAGPGESRDRGEPDLACHRDVFGRAVRNPRRLRGLQIENCAAFAGELRRCELRTDGHGGHTNASDPETLEDHYEKDVITVEKETSTELRCTPRTTSPRRRRRTRSPR